MKPTISTLALVLGLTYAGSVRADFAPEYELGVFGGGHLWNPASGVGRTSSTEDNQVAHGGLLGIRAGIGLHPRFMLETELSLAPSTSRGETSAQVLGIGYRLHGLFHLLTGRIRPYLLVGIGGFTTTSSDVAVYVKDTTYSAAAGGGLKVDIGKRWGLRLDGKVLLQKGLLDGPVLAPDGEVSLGVFGRFGSVPRTAAPTVSDRDHDGITDAVDLCPDLAGLPIYRGCPEAASAPPPPPPIPPERTASPPLPPLPPPQANQ